MTATAWLTALILGLVTVERLAELALARRNTAALLAAGAREHSPGHYPFIVLLHAAWIVGLWALAWGQPIVSPFLVMFVLLQGLRLWVLATLGPRWTTRIIVLPGEKLVRRGPYRVLSHPNYAVVIAEIACLPLVFGLPWYAALFSALNAAALWVRIRTEADALAGAQSDPRPG